MQSLRSVESAGENRRTLLLIGIHGFMGNETGFNCFPAQVHNVLTVTQAESRLVHSKIYTWYRSKKADSTRYGRFQQLVCARAKMEIEGASAARVP